MRILNIVGLILAWGTTFAAIKIGLDHAPPLLFAGIRSVIGALALVPVAVALGRSARVRQHWAAYAVLTLLNVVGFFTLQTLAIDALPSGLAAVLIYLQPVLTGVLAGPLLGERVGRVALVGLLLGFGGIVAVSVGAIRGHVSVGGVLLAVAAALVWSLGTIATKRYASVVDGWWAVSISFGAGGVVMTLAGLGIEGSTIDWSGGFLAALAYSALIGTALAWGLWFALVASGEATKAAALIFFVPLVSVAVGSLVLGEELSWSLVLGAALVVLGVWLVNRPAVREPAAG